MGKGKQPYIPLYIGDWLQDTDCLSIQAEGAWLRIVFKCWKNKGTFAATADVFARLCKVDQQNFASILLEWKINNICDITEDAAGLITIVSRRIQREKEISTIRSENGSKGGSKTQAKGKANKQAKTKQTPDNDIDIEYEIKKDKKESTQKIEYPYVTEEFSKAWGLWLDHRRQLKKPYRSSLSEQTALKKLSTYDERTAIQMIEQSIENDWQGLFEVKEKSNGTRKKNDRTQQNLNDLAIIDAHARGGGSAQ